MATILFAMLPEPGHINPTLKIAKSLKSQGHNVQYVCTPNLKDYILANGLGFISAFESLYQSKDSPLYPFIASDYDTIEQAIVSLKAREGNIQPVLEIIKKESEALFGKIRTDLLITDTYVAYVAALAKLMGIPSMLINTNLFDPWEEIKKNAAALGISEMILCPKEFDFPRQASDNRFYVEASIDLERAPVEFPWDKLSERKPMCFCSLGSQNQLYAQAKEFMESVISAVANKPHLQLVLATGRKFKPEDFYPVPSNVILVGAAPQLELLKRASVMITHGGLNSVKESIFFGVPMIVFPFVRDQPMNAARVVYHGLGVKGDVRDITAQQMSTLIDRVIGEPSFKTRIEAMAARFRQLEESRPGVKIIERALASRQATFGRPPNKMW